MPRVRIVLRDAFRVEDVRGARATATIRRAGHPILHAAFAQVAGRFDDVASRGGREHEAGSLDHAGDDDADGLAGTGRTQHVDVPFGTQPHLHVPRIAHIPCGMPWARTNGARLAVTEILKHARQDGRDHVTVDGAWTVIRGDLTPGGDTGTCGQPVRGPFAGITVRVPEDPQNHDQHERDGEHRQGEQRPREHAAFDEQEHDHGEDQREHAHHRAGTDHEMAFLVGQAFQQMRVPAQPYARLGRFKPFPHVHDLATVVRVQFLTVIRAIIPISGHTIPPSRLFSLEGLVSHDAFRRLDVSNTSAHMGPAMGRIMRGCSCPIRQMP